MVSTQDQGMEETGVAETIESLSRRNRDDPDPALECRLVELRLAAGEALRHAAPKGEVAPPGYPDAFPGCNTLPEISALDLSAATLGGALLHHGGLLVRGLYSEAQVQSLLTLAGRQELVDREDHKPLGTSPHTLFHLLELYRDCGLLQALREYLDGEPLMFAGRAKLRQHRADTHKFAAIPWHQDVSFFGRKSYAVNCWAAVTPCGEGNPGLAIIPRRTEQYHGWSPADGLAPLDYGRAMPEQELASLSEGHPVVEVELQAGDAVLFDEMTVHRTNSRPWNLDQQITTISWFFRSSGFPEWGTPLAV